MANDGVNDDDDCEGDGGGDDDMLMVKTILMSSRVFTKCYEWCEGETSYIQIIYEHIQIIHVYTRESS